MHTPVQSKNNGCIQIVLITIFILIKKIPCEKNKKCFIIKNRIQQGVVFGGLEKPLNITSARFALLSLTKEHNVFGFLITVNFALMYKIISAFFLLQHK